MTRSLPESPLDAAVNLHDLEAWARERLTTNALEYYASGAGDELTARENRAAFARLKLRPRVLRDVSHVRTDTSVLGLPLALPVAAAPSAFHGLAHPEAERATARALAGAGSVMTLSTFSNTPIEDVAREAAGRLWFQLYLYKDREVSRGLIERAEAAGARALVLTVDTPFVGRREANERHRFFLPEHLQVPNAGSREVLAALESESGSQLVRYFQGLVDPSLNWRDLEWLRSVTRLPIVLKGVMTAEDATLAVEAGVEGVWVSNHGGRQLDTAVSSIEALPEVAQAVAGRAEVYLDGGVTRGTDVLKAVALGARAVFLGRPILYGLACGGEAGVRLTLDLLGNELRLAMALAGKASLEELGPDLIWRGSLNP